MVKKTVGPQRGKKIDVQQRDKSHGGPYLLYLIKVVKKTVSPQRGKKIDVQQRDKSHVGSQRKEKHVVHLIKTVKKTMGPQRRKKTRKKENFCTVSYLLHW
jgi:hypothetical protein